ncbi:MAG: Unknown protein [uncultured Thiotrichaceae bacterium]|uniref:Transglycosylase SLT domain-containing protein n=1 Tax=uncultured Thiotrichaceae bacterium TaxID=298394 RepID=A0A6S6TNX4_9GAMM|nr:MAG: Unknown protein [uncultured Thiotrichaceae bacterium]
MKKIVTGCLLGWIYLLSSEFAYGAKKLHDYSELHHNTLASIIDESLYDEGLEMFNKVSKRVKNNIQWKNGKSTNKYVKAHKRCYPYLEKEIRDDMPSFVFLIAYLESGWRADVGNPEHDYGYWQMIPEVIQEIRGLPEASPLLIISSVREIQTHEHLSTEAAFIHIHRYQFYFQHVAGFSEAESWMFTLVAFNWGAGNVKRMLIAMENDGHELSFSTFYAYLVEKSKRNKDDKSMRVAAEYIPNLWNIALLLNRR